MVCDLIRCAWSFILPYIAVGKCWRRIVCGERQAESVNLREKTLANYQQFSAVAIFLRYNRKLQLMLHMSKMFYCPHLLIIPNFTHVYVLYVFVNVRPLLYCDLVLKKLESECK